MSKNGAPLLPNETPHQALVRLTQKGKRKHKYGAERTGEFASKAEARYAAALAMRQQAANGDVEYWLPQVSIKFADGTRYVCDFLVFLRDGEHVYVEVKGVSTPSFKIKMRLLANERPEIFKRLRIVKNGHERPVADG